MDLTSTITSPTSVIHEVEANDLDSSGRFDIEKLPLQVIFACIGLGVLTLCQNNNCKKTKTTKTNEIQNPKPQPLPSLPTTHCIVLGQVRVRVL